MVDFNPDGSIKLPTRVEAAKREEEQRFQNTSCIKITKEVVSSYSPKKCHVHVELSPRFVRNDFIKNIFQLFSERSETPLKFSQQSEKTFQIEVGTSFRRCSECTSLIGQYREHADGNIILRKGNCPYEPREFAYEDYFE